MLERSDTIYKFRGHHAPSRTFDLLSDVANPTRKKMIDQMMETQDWKDTGFKHAFLKLIEDVHGLNRSLLRAGLEYRNDPYAIDLLGTSDFEKKRNLAVINDGDILDMYNLFFADSSQIIMVGCVLDRICNACAIGSHCKITTYSGSDWKIVREIKTRSLWVGVDCKVEKTPDEIYSQISDGTLDKGEVAILRLGDMRDYILRRLIYKNENNVKANQTLSECNPNYFEEVKLQNRIYEARTSSIS